MNAYLVTEKLLDDLREIIVDGLKELTAKRLRKGKRLSPNWVVQNFDEQVTALIEAIKQDAMMNGEIRYYPERHGPFN